MSYPRRTFSITFRDQPSIDNIFEMWLDEPEEGPHHGDAFVVPSEVEKEYISAWLLDHFPMAEFNFQIADASSLEGFNAQLDRLAEPL